MREISIQNLLDVTDAPFESLVSVLLGEQRVRSSQKMAHEFFYLIRGVRIVCTWIVM